MNLTIGEEIEKFKQDYEKGDKFHKWVLGNIAAAEFFKAEQIWNYIQSQPVVTREEAFGEEKEE